MRKAILTKFIHLLFLALVLNTFIALVVTSSVLLKRSREDMHFALESVDRMLDYTGNVEEQLMDLSDLTNDNNSRYTLIRMDGTVVADTEVARVNQMENHLERKEVKDVISYLRLIVNPHDEEAFKRVINYPARGIGDTTLNKLVVAATDHNVSLWTVLNDPIGYALPVNNGTAKKLSDFRELISGFIERNVKLSAEEIAAAVVKESGIVSTLFQDRSVEGISKQENLQELLKGIAEFCEIRREEGMEHVSLADFLSEVSLLTDQDNDKEEQANKVTMMTVHAAKGLEFRNVFVVGLEEDLFPSAMSKDNPRAVEEERRLFYVAITRAEENCVLTHARSRYRNGQSTMCSPSRFLKDIDPKYIYTSADAVTTDGLLATRRSSVFLQPKAMEGEAYVSPVAQAVGRQARLTRMETASLSSAPSSSSAPALSGLHVGAKVRHDRFGEGEVTAIEGEGGNAKATVSFAHFGQKQLLLKFARLTIVE